MLNGMEVVAILGIALIFFGAKKIPELARGLGQGIKEFKKASTDMQNELHQAIDVDSQPATPPKRTIPAETQARTPDVVPAQTAHNIDPTIDPAKAPSASQKA